MKKFLHGFLLLALLLICFSMTAFAASEVTIPATDYVAGKPDRVVNDETVSMRKGNNAGYKINFDYSPTQIMLSLGTNTGSLGTVEIRLDSTTGKLLGTIETQASAWTKVDYPITVTEDISGPHTIYCLFASGTHDFGGITFVVPNPDEEYATFTDSDYFTDIADNSIRTEINLLAELGIIDADREEFKGNQLVSKREFIRSLAGFYDEGVPAVYEQQLFKDVTEDDEDYEAVAWLCTTGVLTPNAGKELKLDGTITLNEACNMLCNMLDYEIKVNALGGDAIRVAKSLNLLDGISVLGGDLKRNEMAQILYNTVESEYNEVAGVVVGKYFIYEKDRNVLKSTGGIYMSEGMVSANQNSNLYSVEGNADISSVIIDDVEYACGKTDAAQYLGFNCIYFYEEVNGVKTLVAIRPQTTVKYEFLVTNEVEFVEINDSIVSYDNGEKKLKELDIDSTAVIMYNGRPADDSLEALIGTEKFYGKVLLIDNNKDKKFDVVMIDQAETIIFGGINGTTVFDSLSGNNIVFDEDADMRLLYGSSASSWSNLEGGTVVDIYRSKNKSGKKLVRAYPIADQVIGVVKVKDSDGKITMEDGSVYEEHPNRKKDVIMGKEVTLKVNGYGAYIDYQVGTPTLVGLIFATSYSGYEGFEGDVMLKMLSQVSNTVEELVTAEKVYVDGILCKGGEEIYNGKDGSAGVAGIAERSIVLYALNGDGEISMLDTINNVKGGDYDMLKETLAAGNYNIYDAHITRFTNDRPQVAALRSGYATLRMSNKDENCVFVDRLASGDANRALGNETMAAAYGFSADSLYSDLVIVDDTTSQSWGKIWVFKEKYIQLGEDGKEEVVLKGINASGEVSYVLNNEVYAEGTDATAENFRNIADALQSGDLVQCKVNASDEAVDMRLHYLHDGAAKNSNGVVPRLYDTDAIYGYDYSRDEGRTYRGTITNREGDFVIITAMDTQSNKEMDTFINGGKIAIISCEKDGNEYDVKKSSGAEMIKGLKTIVCHDPANANPNLIVTYK